MTLQEIQSLLDWFERSSLYSMKLSIQDISLELSHGGAVAAPAAVSLPSPAPVQLAPQREEMPSGEFLRAPLVGTFYAAPASDQAPYVAPGDRVSAGHTVCLIEAMKMMSEVTVPCDCVIDEILAENGSLLEYDAPILRYHRV